MSGEERDPRLLEMRLLAELERKGLTQILPWEKAKELGTNEVFFKSMVLQLMAEECLLGSGPPRHGKSYTDRSGPTPTPAQEVWGYLSLPVVAAFQSQPFAIEISHQGRLRLWRLRDEMNRRRIREPFDILIDRRHFGDDLRIRGWMLADGEPLSVMMSDLDHFKKVNDVLGHATGDEYLRRYLSRVREIATAFGGEAYRYGGDETICIFPGMQVEKASEAAAKLCAVIRSEFEGADSRLANRPTTSVGVVTFARPSQDAHAVLEVVDRQLYAAKDAGRDCFRAASEP